MTWQLLEVQIHADVEFVLSSSSNAQTYSLTHSVLLYVDLVTRVEVTWVRCGWASCPRYRTVTYGHETHVISVGGWSAAVNDANQWIAADFGSPRTVTAIITQGRQDRSEWVTQYRVFVSDDNTNWTPVMRADAPSYSFNGNTDQNSKVSHQLPADTVGQHVKLAVELYHAHISLRWQVQGCDAPAGKTALTNHCYRRDQLRLTLLCHSSNTTARSVSISIHQTRSYKC